MTRHQALVVAKMLQVEGLHLLTMRLLAEDYLNVVAKAAVVVATSWLHLKLFFEALSCVAHYLAVVLIVVEEADESRRYL